MKDKFELYEESGVAEYWIVFPDFQTIQVFQLNNQGKYIGLPPSVSGDVLTTPVIPALAMNVGEIFKD